LTYIFSFFEKLSFSRTIRRSLWRRFVGIFSKRYSHVVGTIKFYGRGEKSVFAIHHRKKTTAEPFHRFLFVFRGRSFEQYFTECQYVRKQLVSTEVYEFRDC